MRSTTQSTKCAASRLREMPAFAMRSFNTLEKSLRVIGGALRSESWTGSSHGPSLSDALPFAAIGAIRSASITSPSGLLKSLRKLDDAEFTRSWPT